MKIPNGTAAVSADGAFYGENQSLGNREGVTRRKGMQPLLQGISQKTYEMALLPFAIYKRGVCRGKTAAVHFGTAALLFFRRKENE